MSMAVEWFKEGGDTMRELLRSKARAAMQRAGYTRLNKPTYDPIMRKCPSGGGSSADRKSPVREQPGGADRKPYEIGLVP